MGIGVSTFPFPQKHLLHFFWQAPLNLQAPFLGDSPDMLVLCDPLPLSDFSVNAHDTKISHS